MKAFVTGGTGFIGRRLVRQLVERNYRVYALARSQAGAETLRALGATVVPGDVTDRESMRAAMRGSDVVFHLAAIYDYTPAAKAQSATINVEGTRQVLGLAHERLEMILSHGADYRRHSPGWRPPGPAPLAAARGWRPQEPRAARVARGARDRRNVSAPVVRWCQRSGRAARSRLRSLLR